MLTKRFQVKIVDFQVAKTALHLVLGGDLLLWFSDSLDLNEPPKSCLRIIPSLSAVIAFNSVENSLANLPWNRMCALFRHLFKDTCRRFVKLTLIELKSGG